MEDKREPSDSYQNLGHIIVSQCPADFTRVVLEAELDEGYADINIVCSMNGGESRRVDLDASTTAYIHDNLDDIWRQMERQTGHRWRTCIFTVLPDRTFNMNVQY